MFTSFIFAPGLVVPSFLILKFFLFQMSIFASNRFFKNLEKILVKLVYNDHPRDHKFVAIVDSWSFIRGSGML
jgi:hypothetical protein